LAQRKGKPNPPKKGGLRGKEACGKSGERLWEVLNLLEMTNEWKSKGHPLSKENLSPKTFFEGELHKNGRKNSNTKQEGAEKRKIEKAGRRLRRISSRREGEGLES